MAAGFSAPLGGGVGKLLGGGATANFISKVIVGGTLSRATGGKFANGAVTAAFEAMAQAGVTSRRDITAPSPNIEIGFDNGEGIAIDVGSVDQTMVDLPGAAMSSPAFTEEVLVVGQQQNTRFAPFAGSRFISRPTFSRGGKPVWSRWDIANGVAESGRSDLNSAVACAALCLPASAMGYVGLHLARPIIAANSRSAFLAAEMLSGDVTGITMGTSWHSIAQGAAYTSRALKPRMNARLWEIVKGTASKPRVSVHPE